MRKILKLIKNLLIIGIIIALVIAGYITYDGYQLYKEVTEYESVETKVKRIQQKENYLAYDEIPEDFSIALVSIEDHRFFKHWGFDLKSIGRAVVNNIKARRLVEGGSTITQQLAKNMYFEFDKDFSRKVAELLVALELESKYDKEEILAMYTSIIYFGEGHYGLKEASEGYYQKSPSELTYDEITLLAGLPNAPSAFNPIENPDLASKRQKLVQNAIEKFQVKLPDPK